MATNEELKRQLAAAKGQITRLKKSLEMSKIRANTFYARCTAQDKQITELQSLIPIRKRNHGTSIERKDPVPPPSSSTGGE